MPMFKVMLIFLLLMVSSMLYAEEDVTTFPNSSIHWSKDGQWIATTHGGDNHLYVWNAATGLREKYIEVPASPLFGEAVPYVAAVRWSPTGDRLAFVMHTREKSLIRIIDAVTYNTLVEITNDGALLEFTSDIQWSLDGTMLAGSNSLGTGGAGLYFVYVWDTTSGELLHETRTSNTIHQIEWNPNPARLALAMMGGPLAQIWDLDTDEVYQLEGHIGALTSINWNLDGTQLVTADMKLVQIWDSVTVDLLEQIYLETAAGSIIWTANGFFADTSHEFQPLTSDGNILPDTKIPLPGRSFALNAAKDKVAISPDSNSIAIYDLEGQVVEFVTPQKVQETVTFPNTSIDWSTDGQWIATTHGSDNHIYVWNAVTGILEERIEVMFPPLFEGNEPQIGGVEFSPLGDRMAVVIDERVANSLLLLKSVIRIIDATSYNTLVEITNDGEFLDLVSDIEWSPDGTMLAGASILGSGGAGLYFVHVWDAESGELLYETRTTSDIYKLEWNPNPARLSLAMMGGPLAQIWDLDTDEVYQLEGHIGALTSISWNLDGTQLVTADMKLVQIWDSVTVDLLEQIYLETAASSIIWTANGFFADTSHEFQPLTSDGNILPDIKIPSPSYFFALNATMDKVAISPDSNSIVIYDLNGGVVPFVTP